MASVEENAPLTFGEWVQQRRHALGLTRAALAKIVGCAEVTIKKIEREERKPSRQIAELLADHLSIPAALRDDFLKMARGIMISSVRKTQAELGIPRFLRPELRDGKPVPPLLFERQSELDWLQAHLERVMAGNGLPIFILGESGSGKTTLMVEFARRAQTISPSLLVACGQCNAQSGMGDPYRPFRDILGMLTGDPGWMSFGFQQEQALRIWSNIPDMIRVITLHGPDLVNLFLPVKSFIQRIAPYLIGPTDWLEPLEDLAQTNLPNRSSLSQVDILEEMTQVLRALASHQPLLLFLDDVQWADDASKNLLYHLGRRLSGSRIMLIAACRSEEISSRTLPGASTAQKEHTIQSLIEELARYYGDIQINLDHADPSRERAFIDALIDSEANNLDHDFRETLVRYTRGQPLFSVELLRHMQEKRHLVRDATGRWVINQDVDIYPLPARIETVIEHRLASLPESYRELLDIASVEGDIFTAQVVSKVLDEDQGWVLKTLARELEGRHWLVQELGEIQVRDQWVSRFQFRHGLFQEYLYNQINSGKRRRIHHAIGDALEEILFAAAETRETTSIGQAGPLGSALLHHFWQGQVWGKAARYALQMGKLAREQFAMREAIAYFDRGIQALDRLSEESGVQVYEAILGWAEAANKFVPYDEQLLRLARAEAIARHMGDKARLVQALHTTANVFLARGLWTQAGPALTECLTLAGDLGDEPLTVRPVFFKALMATFADPPEALVWIRRALSLARMYGDLHIEALALGTQGEVLAQMGDYPGAEKAIQSARRVVRQLGSPLTESDVDLMAAWACLAMGHIEQALVFGQQSVDKAIATDNMECICNGLACIGFGNLELHRIPDATSAFEKGIQRSEVSGAMISRLYSQAGLAVTHFINGKMQALAELEQVIAEMHQYQSEVGAANANLMLGNCLAEIGQLEDAKSHLSRSVDFFRQTRMRPYLAKSLSALAALEEKQGLLLEAQSHRQEVGHLL